MSSKFTPYVVKPESTDPAQPRVVKAPPAEAEAKTYEYATLNKRGSQQNYASTKSKFGALASTDGDRKGRSQRDSRFTLAPMVRSALLVDEEEVRVVEEKVNARVQQLEAEARKVAEAKGYEDGL